MAQAVFTIVAKNYIGLAEVLEQSVKAATPGISFYIFIADELQADEPLTAGLSTNILEAKKCLDIEEKTWYQLAFQYNLVEFCTAIKPKCFEYLLVSKNAGKVIYLDPDVFVYNSLENVFAQLSNASIVLTPHVSQIHTPFNGDYPDYLFLVNGMFNLGFLALKNSPVSRQLLIWWNNRLLQGCYFDNEKGMATDQKWMNFLPCFMDGKELIISKNPGLNAAPWNFFERKLVVQDHKLQVTLRNPDHANEKSPLIFVHFSGYDYKSLINKNTMHKAEGFHHYADWEPAIDRYAEALASSRFTSFLHLAYTYNFFENGKRIIQLNRRIYRRLTECGRCNYSLPFAIGDKSFYRRLLQKKLIDHSTDSTADSVTNKNISGFNRKIKVVNFLFSAVQKIVGIRRYSIFIRFLRRYTREENQFFLFDNKEHSGFY
jgi:hypothetical protein